VVRQPPADRPEGDAADGLQGALRQGAERGAARLRALPGEPSAIARHERLLAETDRLDSAQLTLEDVVSPSGYVLLGFTLDPRTGLGSLREYFDSLLPALRTRPIDEVLALPW
jgi:hypothetical protein